MVFLSPHYQNNDLSFLTLKCSNLIIFLIYETSLHSKIRITHLFSIWKFNAISPQESTEKELQANCCQKSKWLNFYNSKLISGEEGDSSIVASHPTNWILTILGSGKEEGGEGGLNSSLPEGTLEVAIVVRVTPLGKKDAHLGSCIFPPTSNGRQLKDHIFITFIWLKILNSYNTIPEHEAFQFPWAWIRSKTHESHPKGTRQGYMCLHCNKIVISPEDWILYCLLAESRTSEYHLESSFHSHQLLS